VARVHLQFHRVWGELNCVGDLPGLGGWSPDRGIPLVTSLALFPRWTLRKPLKLADDPFNLPSWIEFKYVVRDLQGSYRWEDIGMRHIPVFSSSTAANYQLDTSFIPRPANRCLPSEKVFRLEPIHGVMVRIDQFGRCPVVAEAFWSVEKGWAPDLAGQGSGFGKRCFLLGGMPCCSLTSLAEHVFINRRQAGLLVCFKQLLRSRMLPIDLWRRILFDLGVIMVRK